MNSQEDPTGPRADGSSALPGLYIHVPFCVTKCPYCDFYSVTNHGDMERWLDAVVKEIGIYEPAFHRFDTLYIGGGTPSLLAGPSLTRIFSTLRARGLLTSDAEITLEANPDDITEDKVSLYHDLGINRLSLGIQSFSDRDLSLLRRRHDRAGSIRALKTVRSAGFTDFGIDLMYGLVGQTRKRWLGNLEEALSCEPAHLSCYQLTIEGNTPFGELLSGGEMKPLTESSSRRLFLDTSRFLEARGFIHYEVSNFARGKEHISRHNSKYWDHTPYLGLGPGAHSFLDGKRWWNFRSVEAYCRAVAEGKAPVEGFEVLTPRQMRLEKIYFAFRTQKGIPASELAVNEQSIRNLAGLRRRRLVRMEEGRLFPTRSGYLLADRLPLLFEG